MVTHLRATREDEPADFPAHTSPADSGRIAFSGDFLSARAVIMPTGRRPLNLGRMSTAA